MNFNTKGISPRTVAITDFSLVNKTLAKVIVAFTGTPDAEVVAEMLGAKMQHLAAPVEKSFRILRDGVAVGFVRANRAVRQISESEISASYTKIGASTNVLMDNSDKSLWEIRVGAGGKYLARHGNEDLSELVKASVTHRSDVPKLHQLTMAAVQPFEFVAFASESGDMDYGFCVATASKGEKLKIVSASAKSPVVVDAAMVSMSAQVEIPREAHERITAAGIGRKEIDQSIDYYKRLYSYDPAYLAEVIDQIEGTATM